MCCQMADAEKFLTRNDDRRNSPKVYWKGFEPERLQIHRGVLIHLARQRNKPMKIFQDVIEVL